jgi:hypothetical protein
VLEPLEVWIDHVSREPIRQHIEGPYDLVVTTVKRAVALAESPDVAAKLGKPIWIAVHNQDFLPLRDRLRRLGVHFLIHSSVDDDALRLLLLHTLYRGPEKRDALRLPVGSEVVYHDGVRVRSAELLDLTRDGCRVLTTHAARPGNPVTITLPSPLSRGKPLALRGHVVRTEPPEPADGEHEHRLGVTFEELDIDSRERLAAALAGKAIGTVVTPLADEPEGATADRDTGRARRVERRRRPRAPYAGSVTALLGEARHVLLGRDLSPEGMRVEHLPELKLGASIQLALYGAAREEPLIVQAIVTRNDGEHGTALRFQGDDPEARERIERLVSGGASIEALGDNTRERPVIVSKTLASDRAPTAR